MKLTTFILIAACMQLSATGFSQSISIAEKNAKLESILKKIEKQSGYLFWYKIEALQKASKVDVYIENATVEQTLKQVLKNQPLSYAIVGNTIVLQPKNHSAEAVQALINIRGKVTDEKGVPLPGATVKVKGMNRAVVTDKDGIFVLNDIGSDAVISVSYLGFITQEVAVNDKSSVTVTLKEDSQGLNEVVVVGYGTQKRGSVIGSVSQVSADQIEGRNVSQLSQSLTGQMPGVTIIQRSGRPGAGGGNISVRGVGSFGADPAALVLVDGIPGNLNDVNPNDVESVSVLKDASTAAIYGSRAANGVILVTTKSGKEGKTRISYNGYVGIQKATELPQLVNSWEYAELYNEATGNEVYTPEDIQKFKDGSDPDNYPNTDYIGLIFSRKPVQTAHNIQLTGGNPASRYVVSLGYLNQQGLLERNHYSRYNLRVNLTNEIRKNLTLSTRLSGVSESIHEPVPPGGIENTDMSDIIQLAVRMPAIYAGKLSNGDYGTGHAQMGTPLSMLDNASFYQDKPFSLNANMRLDWQAIPDLKLSLIGGYQRISRYQKRFLATQRLNDNITLGPASVNQINNTTYYGTMQGLAEYDKTIDKHHFGILGGYSYETNRFETLDGYREKLPSNDLSEINVGSPEGQQVQGSANEWALQSFFGRIRYDFANKYLLESTMRYDGSSRFPAERKYAFFPSAAIGWRVSEEDFFKNAVPWVSDLKLKASYGELGNQNIGNYPYQTVLQSGFGYPFGGSMGSGVAVTALTDPLLHWESTKTADAGIDLSLLNGELELSANYFNRKTFNILYKPTASVSSVLGKELSETNTGSLRNYGWEFTANYRKTLKDFGFSLSPNFSIINNKVLDLGVGNIYQPNGMIGNGSSLFIGYPMQLYYGYVADGLYVDRADIDNWADVSKINPDPQPGDIKYKDISGPDGVPDGKVNDTYDRVVLGSQIPKYTFGMALGAKYKGFDLNALVQGVAKVKGKLTSYAGYAFYNTASIQRWMMEERWSPENPNPHAGYPRLELISNQGTPNTLESSFWLPDASYVRLKNIQLGYSIPGKALSNWKMQSLRIYVAAENLFTWNKYREGWDPEINGGGAFYPIFTNYTFGFNVNF